MNSESKSWNERNQEELSEATVDGRRAPGRLQRLRKGECFDTVNYHYYIMCGSDCAYRCLELMVVDQMGLMDHSGENE